MTDQPKPKPPRPGVNPFGVGGGAPTPRRATRPRTRKQRVAEQLGATPDEVAEMDADDLTGITVTDAARLLGHESMRDRRARAYYAGPWRYAQLARFGTQQGRRRLVALLERELRGDEVQVPKDVKEAVLHLLAADRRQRPDVPVLFGYAGPEYHRIARERATG